jgi:Flp pilus assembly protein TadG
MVEFALVSPVALVLLIGLVVVGIVITHQMQLNQGAKSSARAVAICAVAKEQDPYQVDPGTLPNGTSCANIQTYIDDQFTSVSSSLASRDVVTVSGAAWSVGQACTQDEVIEVSINYEQPLFVPLVGYVFGDGGSDTRLLSAYGQATC